MIISKKEKKFGNEQHNIFPRRKTRQFSINSEVVETRNMEKRYKKVESLNEKSLKFTNKNVKTTKKFSKTKQETHLTKLQNDFKINAKMTLDKTFPRQQRAIAENTVSNQGVWDILAALNWVKEHIVCFGGDPGQVTLLTHGLGASIASSFITSGPIRGWMLFWRGCCRCC